MHQLKGIGLLIIGILLSEISFSQYIVNGSATKESCNCYVLTTENLNLSGSVWQATKINLNNPFDFTFSVYLGCRDENGADGIVFILQPISTSVGNTGQGLGFQGIKPSLGIPLDTWQNTGDPAYDNISIKVNGDISHNNNLAGPLPASASSDNIEDCTWHKLRIVWNPSNDSLATYFDDVFRLGAKVNLVKDIFNNDPMVYWGFSGATGGAFNLQKFCNIMDASFDSQLPDESLCLGETVYFKNKSLSFLPIQSHSWDFGDGKTSTVVEPSYVYKIPGKYKVVYKFTAIDGCESPAFIQEIAVGDFPRLSMKVLDTCEGLVPRFDTSIISSIGAINGYKWLVNNQLFSDQKSPDFTVLKPGNYNISLQLTSQYGCISNISTDDFIIKPKPAISFMASDGCKDKAMQFNADLSGIVPVNNWEWEFERGVYKNGMSASYTFKEKGDYHISLTALGVNGCLSKFEKDLFINSLVVNAGKDTIVVPNTLVQLNASGGISYSWNPATGLSSPYIQNPVATAADDIRYVVTATSVEGCIDTASMSIIVFKGAAIYVPNAFTPNGDGINDFLKPYLVGIKSLTYFTIYDRWGNKIFTTTRMNDGWNGTFKGKKLDAGSYAWVLGAVDLLGKAYFEKGTFTLID